MFGLAIQQKRNKGYTMLTTEEQITILEDKKKFQEYIITHAEKRQISGTICFGSLFLSVRVEELSERTKNAIIQLVIGDIEQSVKDTDENIQMLISRLTK